MFILAQLISQDMSVHKQSVCVLHVGHAVKRIYEHAGRPKRLQEAFLQITWQSMLRDPVNQFWSQKPFSRKL